MTTVEVGLTLSWPGDCKKNLCEIFVLKFDPSSMNATCKVGAIQAGNTVRNEAASLLHGVCVDLKPVGTLLDVEASLVGIIWFGWEPTLDFFPIKTD